MDNNFDNYEGDIKGISFTNTGFSLAKKLNNDGFTNLYLFSGDKFDSVPPYLKVVAKHNYDDIEALLNPSSTTPQKPDDLIRSEIFRERMIDFACANYRDNQYYLSDIDDMADETLKGRLQSKASIKRLDSIRKSAKEFEKTLKDDGYLIRQAESIFNGDLGGYDSLFQFDISENIIHELSWPALKNDVHLLDNHDIRKPTYFSPFTVLGNKLIMEVIIIILLRYTAKQIKQQTGAGHILVDAFEAPGHNQLRITYALQMLDPKQEVRPVSFENLPEYSENLEFCKNTMQLFGGEISLARDEDDNIQIVLTFPKLKGLKKKKPRILK